MKAIAFGKGESEISLHSRRLRTCPRLGLHGGLGLGTTKITDADDQQEHQEDKQDRHTTSPPAARLGSSRLHSREVHAKVKSIGGTCCWQLSTYQNGLLLDCGLAAALRRHSCTLQVCGMRKAARYDRRYAFCLW